MDAGTPRAWRSTACPSAWCATWRPGKRCIHRRAGQAPYPAMRRDAAAHAVHLRVRVFRAARLQVSTHISVYRERGMRYGRPPMADKILREHTGTRQSTFVIPIPDTSRTSAPATRTAPRREVPRGLHQETVNIHIGRTFIMPGQDERERSVQPQAERHRSGVPRQDGCLLVDDSIVRVHDPRRRSIELGARGGRRQGVLRLRRPAGALPERLRYRHAGGERAGGERAERWRRSGAPHRRRLARLPGTSRT